MSNEQNKPVELTEEELAGIVGGGDSWGDGYVVIPEIVTEKHANKIKFEIDPPLV